MQAVRQFADRHFDSSPSVRHQIVPEAYEFVLDLSREMKVPLDKGIEALEVMGNYTDSLFKNDAQQAEALKNVFQLYNKSIELLGPANADAALKLSLGTETPDQFTNETYKMGTQESGPLTIQPPSLTRDV